MREAAAASRARPGWWRFVLALLAFLLFGYVPVGTAFAPIGPAFLLVAGVVVACVLIAVAIGERPSIVPLAVAVLGAALVTSMPEAASEYRYLVIGWAVVLSASFGIVSLASPAQTFFSRALATVALAFVVAVLAGAMFGDGLERVRGAMYAEAVRRSDVLDLEAREWFASQSWRDAEAKQPQVAAMRTAYDSWVHALPARTIMLLPAMLALQSLAALALGWGLFHRLSRVSIGPPLAPLREFRFNDQLVWAIAVGLTILVLPEFSEGRAAGVNILLFFGGLFVIRGLAVLVSLRRGRLLLVATILLFVVAWPIALAVALMLGLADVWLDVRKRTRTVP